MYRASAGPEQPQDGAFLQTGSKQTHIFDRLLTETPILLASFMVSFK
jgi:hypothetical protein